MGVQNKRTSENEYVYFEFLRNQVELAGQEARLQVFLLQSKRDGWWKIVGDAWTLDERLGRCTVFYKQGGLFDRWLDTGTLPVWTPEVAG